MLCSRTIGPEYMTRLKRFSAMALGIGLVCMLSPMPSTSQAQGTISVVFPTRLAAAPDYATEVLGDPWDMCNLDDMSLRPDERVGFSSFSFGTGQCIAGGTTMAVNGTNDSSLMMLSPGLYDVALNPGRNGRNFPIDPSKYQVLSFKLSLSATEDPQIWWFHNPVNHPSGVGLGGRLVPRMSAGTQLVVADLTQSLLSGSVPWTSGVVRALRIDPNALNAVENVFLYWVRLTPSASSPLAAKQTITWNGSGAATITVRDNGDGSVFPVVSNLSGNSYPWNYGVLAPGSYTLTVTNASGSGSTSFSINNPPRIDVTNPSVTSGDDYATTVLGNAWDMSNSNDIQLTGLDHLTNVSFSSGLLHATNTNSDPIVTLLYNTNNAVPIDTSRFRYLTFRMQLDGPYDLLAGSVARVIWGTQVSSAAAVSQDVIVVPGMNSYTIDLATLSTAPDGGLEPGSGETWTASSKRYLRLDPHEFPDARTFHIDDVKLTARPVATGSFNIRFVGTDADGDAATVSLYYDADTNPGNGKSLIASNIPVSAGQFVWNPAGVPLGEYYIYAEATDGIQVMGRYSNLPVRLVIAPPAPTGLRFVPR
jgi:hypothetical protein